jgi:serine/threonine-protein kinase
MAFALAAALRLVPIPGSVAPGDLSQVLEVSAGAMVTPSIRLVRELGRGGMGSVWLAEHLRLHAQVVVKFMAAEYTHSPEALMRFEREATLAAQAKSPHVVQVFDHGVSQFGLPYIAMELLEVQDLGRRIEKQGSVPPALLANWFSQACRGISRAHTKGIVHRDIKPENIYLCDNDGEVLVKVLDFGIAKADASAGFSGTQTGVMLGTAYYMSPEQTMGQKDLDHRSDLWSLGVVVYYALTGVRPFEADAIGALVLAITVNPVVPPSVYNRGLSPAIDAWMAKALARPREQRFQSAKEMADAFQQAVGASGPISVAPPSHVLAPQGPASGGVPARTAPAPFRASTMSPSVRPEVDVPPPRKASALPLLFAVAGAGVVLGGAAWGYSRWSAAEQAASATPSVAPPAADIASAAAEAARPAAPAPSTKAPASSTTESPPAPSVSARPEAAPAAAVKPARRGTGTAAKAAPAAAPVAAPAPAKPVAAPAPTPAPAPAAAPKPAPTANNPLKMKME